MRSVSEANRQKQEKKQRNLAQAGRQVRIAGAFLLLIMLLLLSLIWSICSGSVSVPIMEFYRNCGSLSCVEWRGRSSGRSVCRARWRR